MGTAFEPIHLNLSYKGDRHYVQGADIWRATELALSENLHGAVLTQLCFREIATGQVSILPGPSERSFGELSIQDRDGRRQDLVLIDNGVPLDSRRPYDESLIVGMMSLSDGVGLLKGSSPYALEDTVISMIKAVCYEDGEPAIGKWLFVRMSRELAMPAAPSSVDLRVERVQQIKGRFAKCQVYSEGRHFSSIDFCAGTV